MELVDSDAVRIRLATDVFARLATIRATVRADVRESLRPFHLRPDAYAVACLIGYPQVPSGSTAIAAALGLSRASVHRILKQLESDGLILGTQNPNDKRFNLWTISSEGRGLHREMRGVVLASFAQNLEQLTSGVQDRLRRDLTQLAFSLLNSQGAHLLGKTLESIEQTQSDPDPLTRKSALAIEFNLILQVAYQLARAEQTQHLLAATGGMVETPHYMTLYHTMEPTPMADVAQFLQVDMATMTRITDRLVALQYLTRHRNPLDGRQVLLACTPLAEDLLTRVPPFSAEGRLAATLRQLAGGGTRLVSDLAMLSRATLGERVFDSALAQSLPGSNDREGAAHLPPLSASAYRSAMGQHAAGVTLMTAGLGNEHRGITVNSVASVSLSPPRLLVCLKDAVPLLEIVTRSGYFVLNFLSADQRAYAERFGSPESRGKPHDLSGLPIQEVGGVPIIKGSLSSMICRVDQMIDVGDHTVVIGAPTSVHRDRTPTDSSPLIHWRGEYRSLDLIHDPTDVLS